MKILTDFPYKNVLVLGLAKSGTAAAHLLLDSGINVRINDLKADETSKQVRALKEKGAEVITGGHPLTALEGIDLMIKNPGIPYEVSMVAEAVERKIPVVTEVELAGHMHKGPIIGVTGSNGKTTTTTLIHEMIKADKKPVSVAGNIGKVACEVARHVSKEDTMVVELSSFQLQGTLNFRPNLSVMLNLYEAHLDYHHTLTAYHEAKVKLIENQTEEDQFVYNADDTRIVHYLTKTKAQKIPFSLQKQGEGAWIDSENIYFYDEQIMKRKDIVLVGPQNMQNILAAVAAVKSSGVSNQAIHHVLTTFTGVEHRLQYVTETNGRQFYNDSKATNILATSYALRSFKQPVILLAGGLDRGNHFDELAAFLTGVKSMIVFGETSDKLRTVAESADVEHIKEVESMNEAVQAAYDASNRGDVILLSPACASWDQYKTFEERGNMFIEAVHKLK